MTLDESKTVIERAQEMCRALGAEPLAFAQCTAGQRAATQDFLHALARIVARDESNEHGPRLTRANIVNGTGFGPGARFVQVSE